MAVERPGGKQYTTADMRWKLQQLAAHYGSQDKLAQRLGISPQYLCDVLHGRRALSGRVAKRLGYERVIRYVEAGT